MITQVDARVWRGPQPKFSEFPAIKAKFNSVVSLIDDLEEVTEVWPKRFLLRPISDWQIYQLWGEGVSVSRLNGIVNDIQCAPAPVLVHCLHGEDRTGLVIAAYRVVSGQLSPADAWAEALKFGYRKLINFGLNRTWKEFVKSRQS